MVSQYWYGALMSSGIDYYVVCHDQNIILSLEDRLIDHPYQWVFVGNTDTSKISNNNNTIIAKNFIDNIEHMPTLCSFTGWYAIAKNIPLNNKSLVLLEYDIISKHLSQATTQAFDKQITKTVFGYKCIPCGHLVFTKSTPWLEIGLKKIYNIDLQNIFPNLPNEWMASTNIAFRDPNIFYSFVDWFMPLAKFCSNKPMGGYVHERALHIFLYMYYPNTIGCINNSITHQEYQSHKQKDVCAICRLMEPQGSTHNCIKWLYKNLYERYIDDE